MPNITAPMRDLLLEHITAPVEVRVRINYRRKDLIERARKAGLISYQSPGWGGGHPKHPRFTYITKYGRGILSHVLAQWADRLSRKAAQKDRFDDSAVPSRSPAEANYLDVSVS